MQRVSDMSLHADSQPLSTAEATAISAGRRLYRAGIIAGNATVNTILCHTASLEPHEQLALGQIGDRSFGICARAGMLYQQSLDLLSELPGRPAG
jgi:hypothetical protein